MGYFSDQWANDILDTCKNARKDGVAVGDIVKVLSAIIQYLIDYML